MKEKQFNASDIQSLSSREWLKKYVFDKLTLDYLPILKAIFISHPFAQTIKTGNSQVIQAFGKEESTTAVLFANLCREYINILQLQDDLIYTIETNGTITISSEALINHLKTIDFNEQTKTFEPSAYFAASKQPEDASAFSYLLGKYIRFYRDDGFVIQSPWEAFMIEDLIARFSSSGDTVTTIKKHGYVPGATIIQPNADHILLEYLSLWKNKWVKSNL